MIDAFSDISGVDTSEKGSEGACGAYEGDVSFWQLTFRSPLVVSVICV